MKVRNYQEYRNERIMKKLLLVSKLTVVITMEQKEKEKENTFRIRHVLYVPSKTFPNTTCLPSSQGVATVVTKN